MATEKPEEMSKKKNAFVEAWRTHPIGYPRLSERMGVSPETLIFRKFIALNARMLLYMQAELVMLENQLHHAEKQDNEDKEGNKWRYATNFRHLMQSY